MKLLFTILLFSSCLSGLPDHDPRDLLGRGWQCVEIGGSVTSDPSECPFYFFIPKKVETHPETLAHYINPLEFCLSVELLFSPGRLRFNNMDFLTYDIIELGPDFTILYNPNTTDSYYLKEVEPLDYDCADLSPWE